MNWELVIENKNTEHSFNAFQEMFSRAYNKAFPKKEVIIKQKTLKSPWITKSLLKSSKRKQRLYEIYLKNKSYQNEKRYKAYKNLFEKVKQKAKKNYYSNLIKNAEGNSKKTWDAMKEIIGKSNNVVNTLPKQLNYKNQIINCNAKIAETFNDFFSSIGKNLASKIPTSNKDFLSYFEKTENVMASNQLTSDEFNNAFKSLQSNKSPGIDEISDNVVKKTFDIIKPILMHIFNLSLTQGIFQISYKLQK